MSYTQTTNLNLRKDDADEKLSDWRPHNNSNMDAIDTAVASKLDASRFRGRQTWGDLRTDGVSWGDLHGTSSTPSSQSSTTTNYSLLKPGYDATADIDAFNDNMDIIDSALGNTTKSIAPIEQTTALSNHSIGEHFILNNELRKATAAIVAGTTIDNTNSTLENTQTQIDALRDSLDTKAQAVWTQILSNISRNTSNTFSMAGRNEIYVSMRLNNTYPEWFSYYIAEKGLLISTTRNFNFGNKQWSFAFKASISGDTVTCSLASDESAEAKMWVYVR